MGANSWFNQDNKVSCNELNLGGIVVIETANVGPSINATQTFSTNRKMMNN
jgi:hypothetical protein